MPDSRFPTPTFEPTGYGRRIFQERYAARPDESWAEACERVARAVAVAENGSHSKWEQEFYNDLSSGLFSPGGRIWFGAGQPNQQMLNCFVVPTEDTIEGWGKTISDVLTISARGGGVGINFSPVRGQGYPIRGMRGDSTGSLSPMQMIDRCGDVLIGGGSRRIALMLCLFLNHPDIKTFMSKKLDREELNNANVSIVLPPDMSSEEFVRLVRADAEIPLMFNGLPDRICANCSDDETFVDKTKCACGNFTPRTISAKALWDTVVENSWESGEPGFLNSYLANQMNNIWYHKPLIATNPCGEIWLEEYGCCCLGALVLPRFVEGGEFNWALFDKTIRNGVRFLDDVLDVNQYPLPEIEKNCKEVRRIGQGYMGLHTMLMKLGMKYNSEEAFAFVDKLGEFKKNTEYDESATLAAAKGAFPAFDPRLLDSGFAQTLKPGIRNKIAHHGLRNCALGTVAPTGTTSMPQAGEEGMSAGIEPEFAPVYIRTHITGLDKDGKPQKDRTLVVTASQTLWPDIAQGAYDIPPRDHLRMQVVVQKHVDNAVSKTINIPKDYPKEELSEAWLDHLDGMKGSTVYREGSRGEEPLQYVPVDQVAETIASWEGDIEYQAAQDAEVDDCASGVCELPMAPTTPVSVAS